MYRKFRTSHIRWLVSLEQKPFLNSFILEISASCIAGNYFVLISIFVRQITASLDWGTWCLDIVVYHTLNLSCVYGLIVAFS